MGPNDSVRCDGQTHLWEMIKDKVENGEIKPTVEEIYIITDGEDNQSSPADWQGIDGSKKLMDYANIKGVNLTINFIGIDMETLISDPQKAQELHNTFEKEGGKCVVVDTDKTESIQEQVKTVIDQDPLKVFERELNKQRHSLIQLNENDEAKSRRIRELEALIQHQGSRSIDYAGIVKRVTFQILKSPFAAVAFAGSSGIRFIDSCEKEIVSRNFWGICKRRNTQSDEVAALVREGRVLLQMIQQQVVRSEAEYQRRQRDSDLKDEEEKQSQMKHMEDLKEQMERLKQKTDEHEKEKESLSTMNEELQKKVEDLRNQTEENEKEKLCNQEEKEHLEQDLKEQIERLTQKTYEHEKEKLCNQEKQEHLEQKSKDLCGRKTT